MTALITKLVLLASTMMTTMIVVIVSSVQPVAPALVRKTSQFAFVAHALWQLTSLQQWLLS
jgi:hypothetical protein